MVWLVAGCTSHAVTTDVPLTDMVGSPGGNGPPPVWCGSGTAAGWRGQAFVAVQDAIDAAASGDVVVVCPGTHLVNLTIPATTELTLRGATGDPADVILDGQNVGTVITAGHGPGFPTFLRVEGLTIRHGRSDSNGSAPAIHFYAAQVPDSQLDIVSCRIDHNLVDIGDGGAVQFSGEFLDIRRSIFADNRQTTNSAGGAVSATLTGIDGKLRVIDSVFERNSTEDTIGWGAGEGAGVYGQTLPSSDGLGAVHTYVFDRVSFRDNIGGNGVALAVVSVSDALVRIGIRDSVFERNVGIRGLGGGPLGFYPERTSTFDIRLEDTFIEDNVSGYASAVELNGASSSPYYSTFLMRGGAVRRNLALLPDLDSVAIEAVSSLWHLDFEEVDLGSGSDANKPQDFVDCFVDSGPKTTGEVDYWLGDRCP